MNLSHNQLTSFPLLLASLPQLDLLNLSSNSITALPEGIEGLQAVELNLNENQVHCATMPLLDAAPQLTHLHPSVAGCPRLVTLRLERNLLAPESLPAALLRCGPARRQVPPSRDSAVSLLCLEGNPFPMKELEQLEDWSRYMERFTAAKRKTDFRGDGLPGP